jgi:hypothetical protein
MHFNGNWLTIACNFKYCLTALPENEKILKASLGEYCALNEKKKLGYHFQYSKYVAMNNAGENFTKQHCLMGGSWDWSWSALFADYDQDMSKNIL